MRKGYLKLLMLLVLMGMAQTVLGQAKQEAFGVEGAETPALREDKKQYQCYVYSKYIVFATPTEDGVGEDILVAARPQATAAAKLCDKRAAKTHLLVKNDDSNFFFGLSGNHLFVDIGTGPEPRGLSVYDLAQKKKIYDTSYNTPIKMAAGPSLDYWTPLEKDLPRSQCPQAKKWEKEGLGYGFERRVMLDLTTLKEKTIGKPRCTPRQ